MAAHIGIPARSKSTFTADQDRRRKDALPDNDLSQRFAGIRQCFPGTTAGPYLDVSARCLLYSRARKAFDAYLDQNGDGTLDKKAMFAGVERTRGLFARLIRADADEIAFTRNVTDGIATLAASLPWLVYAELWRQSGAGGRRRPTRRASSMPP